jgi:hypothetical protein
VQARRSKQTDHDLPGDFLDCDTCTDALTRRCFGCGWLPESEWLAGDRPFPEASVCPGYSTRLPEVIEAARALSWQKRGGLLPLYGNRRLPDVAADAMDILEGARNEAEAAHYREMRQEREQG